MRFLVDAHLPYRLVQLLRYEGHDVIPTSELARGNRTSNSEINEISGAEQRIVVTKDTGFVSSYHLSSTPFKLLLATTGNISNSDLLNLFQQNLGIIDAAFQDAGFVELDRDFLTIHR